MPHLARIARPALVATLLLLVAACGVTGDDDADGTTTTTEASTTTTEDEATTTTEDDGATTSTTEPDDEGEEAENDPELEELLITADDVSELAQVEVEVDPDTDPGFTEEEFCEGQSFTVAPQKQAAVGFQSAGLESFLNQAILEFGFEEDASLFLEELISLNELCKDSDPEDSIPATFEEVDGLADEAVRSVLDEGAEEDALGLDVVVARQGERIVLLAAFGEPILAEALLVEAVERAAP
jgi:hypothetical protein